MRSCTQVSTSGCKASKAETATMHSALVVISRVLQAPTHTCACTPFFPRISLYICTYIQQSRGKTNASLEPEKREKNLSGCRSFSSPSSSWALPKLLSSARRLQLSLDELPQTAAQATLRPPPALLHPTPSTQKRRPSCIGRGTPLPRRRRSCRPDLVAASSQMQGRNVHEL